MISKPQIFRYKQGLLCRTFLGRFGIWWTGLKYSSCVEKLVYLDAYDLATRLERPEVPPVPYLSGDCGFFADFPSCPGETGEYP